MVAVMKAASKITAKGQTTVPKRVREVLGVGSGDEIVFVIENGTVSVERSETESPDPAIDRFLAFLARDIAAHPERAVVGLAPALKTHIDALTAGIAVDLDAPIDGDVDL